MHLVVVPGAQQDSVLDVRLAVVAGPPADVVDLAPAGGDLAPGETARLVPHDDAAPLTPGEEALLAAQLGGLPVRPDHQRREVDVAQDPTHQARRQDVPVVVDDGGQPGQDRPEHVDVGQVLGARHGRTDDAPRVLAVAGLVASAQPVDHRGVGGEVGQQGQVRTHRGTRGAAPLLRQRRPRERLQRVGHRLPAGAVRARDLPGQLQRPSQRGARAGVQAPLDLGTHVGVDQVQVPGPVPGLVPGLHGGRVDLGGLLQQLPPEPGRVDLPGQVRQLRLPLDRGQHGLDLLRRRSQDPGQRIQVRLGPHPRGHRRPEHRRGLHRTGLPLLPRGLRQPDPVPPGDPLRRRPVPDSLRRQLRVGRDPHRPRRRRRPRHRLEQRQHVLALRPRQRLRMPGPCPHIAESGPRVPEGGQQLLVHAQHLPRQQQ
ncbi:hypothetical protein SAMN05421867_101176 [Cellulomonas marina]|uniref:Uncharacterized protein n=1 Tax=Cellulomonas marina TaxID=988821 RepID=A0A1I0V692_9CELL|nr:hypothetical protein SAMN05421867_101176 [Cellulomonas marina]